MDEVAERSVRMVIESMHENLGHVLSLDDMAKTAMFSKFHFSRIFQRVTGLSPARFLSAVRLERAKQLLVSTSMSVTQISHTVGYASVGTFSSRFSSSVGMSPSRYRQLNGRAGAVLPPADPDRVRSGPAAAIRGRVTARQHELTRPIFIALFPERLPQGRPVRCGILTEPGPYVLADVPPGTWYVLAYSGPATDPAQPPAASSDPEALVAVQGPVPVKAGSPGRYVDLDLRPVSPLDPPMLLALPQLAGISKEAT